MRCIVFVFILSLTVIQACAQQGDIFQDVGDNIASPTSMWIDVATNRLYLVNSNSRVLYNWQQGNFQVLDITNPLAPTLIKSILTDSFSGEIYVDLAVLQAYVPNRFTADDQDTEDRLYTFNIDETAGADLLSFATSTLGRDSYAIACCYPANRAWITTSLNELQYIDILSADKAPSNLSLLATLDDGTTFSNSEVYHVVIRNNQAFLTRYYGGVFVIDLDEVGVAGAVPIDYYINDIPNPRGIAIDGDTLYVVGEGNEGGNWTRFVLILDVSTLTPLNTNTNTQKLDKDDDGLLQAFIEVEKSPQEVLLSTDYAFVTNLESDTVSVVDRAAMLNVANLAVGDQPFSMGLYTTAGGVDQYLYVGNLEDNTLSIIDIPSLTVVATYP